MRSSPKFVNYLLIACLVFTLPPAYVMAQDKPLDQTLQQQLDALNKRLSKTMNPAFLKNINEAISEINSSELIANAKNEGDQAPDFTLPDATGKQVHLYDLLKNGPVVLTWYRGNW